MSTVAAPQPCAEGARPPPQGLEATAHWGVPLGELSEQHGQPGGAAALAAGAGAGAAAAGPGGEGEDLSKDEAFAALEDILELGRPNTCNLEAALCAASQAAEHLDEDDSTPGRQHAQPGGVRAVMAAVVVGLMLPRVPLGEYEEERYAALGGTKRYLHDAAAEGYETHQEHQAAAEPPSKRKRRRLARCRRAEEPAPLPPAPPPPAATRSTGPASSPPSKPLRIFRAVTAAFGVVRQGGGLVVRAPREAFVVVIDRVGQEGYARNNTRAMTSPALFQRDNNPEFRTWSLMVKLLGEAAAGPYNTALGPYPTKNAWAYREKVMEGVKKAGILPTGTLPAASTKTTQAFGWTDYKRGGGGGGGGGVGDAPREERGQRGRVRQALRVRPSCMSGSTAGSLSLARRPSARGKTEKRLN